MLSNQYDILAKKNISVEGLIRGEKVNQEKLTEILFEIDNFYQEKDIEIE